MGYRAPHPGPLTACKGAEVLVAGFRINGTSDPDFVWDSNAGTFTVARDSAGTFTCTIGLPYPRSILAVIPHVAQATANTTIEDARYVLDSYDSTDGTFQIETITDDGDGTLTVEDLTDNVVVFLWIVYQTTNVFNETQS